jgi:hypothetical protein
VSDPKGGLQVQHPIYPVTPNYDEKPICFQYNSVVAACDDEYWKEVRFVMAVWCSCKHMSSVSQIIYQKRRKEGAKVCEAMPESGNVSDRSGFRNEKEFSFKNDLFSPRT